MADLGAIGNDSGASCVSYPPKSVSGQAFHAGNPGGPFRYQVVLYHRSTLQFVNVGGIEFDGRFFISTTIPLENDLHLVVAYNPVSGQVNAEAFDSITPVVT